MSETSSSGPTSDTSRLEQYGYTQELKRSLSMWDLMIFGLVIMVPIAPFGIFGSVYNVSGGMVALAYIIGVVGMAFTAVSYAEMSREFPMAGSVYTYAGRGINGPIGFIGGWMITLDYLLVPALLYVVSGVAVHSFIPSVPVWVWVVLFIVANTGVNYFGIEITVRVMRYMLVAEVIVLAIFLAIGMWALANGAGAGFSSIPFYDERTFSIGLVFSAVSVAVLSFLGFDAISTLAEESKGGSRSVGPAMIGALVLAATLFVVQTWVASLLVPNREQLLAGEGVGNAFYDAAAVAGGQWLSVLCAIATAIAWGFVDSLLAQAAVSRLLYVMARDRQLPSFLGKVHPVRRVPVNAMFVIAVISVALGVYMASRDDGIELLSSLVNFGALTAFLLLHLAVLTHFVFRRRSRSMKHWLVPACGLSILGYVLWSANIAAQTIGLIWLGTGIVVTFVLYFTGKRLELSEVPERIGDNAVDAAGDDGGS